jgi:hypothetical protein
MSLSAGLQKLIDNLPEKSMKMEIGITTDYKGRKSIKIEEQVFPIERTDPQTIVLFIAVVMMRQEKPQPLYRPDSIRCACTWDSVKQGWNTSSCEVHKD